MLRRHGGGALLRTSLRILLGVADASMPRQLCKHRDPTPTEGETASDHTWDVDLVKSSLPCSQARCLAEQVVMDGMMVIDSAKGLFCQRRGRLEGGLGLG